MNSLLVRTGLGETEADTTQPSSSQQPMVKSEPAEAGSNVGVIVGIVVVIVVIALGAAGFYFYKKKQVKLNGSCYFPLLW